MFRKMRRFKQELSAAEAREILEKGSCGVLACAGYDGYPYAVPVSYVFHDGHIYFHSAMEGHKIDAIRGCEKVSFCVVGQDHVVPEELTTYFRSAVAFGRARLIEDETEKRAALTLLGLRYLPNGDDEVQKHIDGAIARTAVVDIAIEHLSGKEAIELVRRKNRG